MDKNVFIISPPADTDPGVFFLLVTRGGGAFGGGHPSVFAVDGLIYNPHYIAGYLGEENHGTVVVQFPVATSYILVKRDLVSSTTQLALAKEQHAEDKEIEEALGVNRQAPEDIAVSHPGQFI